MLTRVSGHELVCNYVIVFAIVFFDYVAAVIRDFYINTNFNANVRGATMLISLKWGVTLGQFPYIWYRTHCPERAD
jgi:hypothetical protein